MSSPICSSPGEPDRAAFTAFDWGSKRHAWSLRPATGGNVQDGILDNTPEAVDLWAMELHQRFSGRPIAVAVEQKRGPLVYMLGKYAHLFLHPRGAWHVGRFPASLLPLRRQERSHR